MSSKSMTDSVWRLRATGRHWLRSRKRFFGLTMPSAHWIFFGQEILHMRHRRGQSISDGLVFFGLVLGGPICQVCPTRLLDSLGWSCWGLRLRFVEGVDCVSCCGRLWLAARFNYSRDYLQTMRLSVSGLPVRALRVLGCLSLMVPWPDEFAHCSWLFGVRWPLCFLAFLHAVSV